MFLVNSSIKVERKMNQSPDKTQPYNCWICGTALDLSDNMSDKRKACPECGTMNAQPSVDRIEEKDKNECYYCQTTVENLDNAFSLKAKKTIENPKYSCLKCNSNWQVNTRAEGKANKKRYFPVCPNCQSKDVKPSELPPIPIGKYYKDFKNKGIYIESDPKSSSHELRKLVLGGSIDIPRCIKCKENQSRIQKISFRLSTVIYSLSLLGIIFIYDDYYKDKVSEQLAIVVFLLILVWLPAFFLLKFILCRTIWKGFKKKSDLKLFPAVKGLEDENWICE